MLSIEAHATLSLLLNGLFLALAAASCFCDYFSFLVRLRQDYQVGLVTITHRLRFEDVEGKVGVHRGGNRGDGAEIAVDEVDEPLSVFNGTLRCLDGV